MMLDGVKSICKKNWSGYEFFGLYRKDVMNVLTEHSKPKSNFEGPLKDIGNIRHRNAGPTEHLSSKQAMDSRNKMIE